MWLLLSTSLVPKWFYLLWLWSSFFCKKCAFRPIIGSNMLWCSGYHTSLEEKLESVFCPTTSLPLSTLYLLLVSFVLMINLLSGKKYQRFNNTVRPANPANPIVEKGGRLRERARECKVMPGTSPWNGYWQQNWGCCYGAGLALDSFESWTGSFCF